MKANILQFLEPSLKLNNPLILLNDEEIVFLTVVGFWRLVGFADEAVPYLIILFK